MAGFLIAAVCVAFSPPLQAAVELETFTDYNAFLSLLNAEAPAVGEQTQVVNFDDVPTVSDPIEPEILYAYLDPNRYANQGIVIHGQPSQIVLSRPAEAVSPPNVYQADLGAGPNEPPGAFRETTFLSFTRDGQSALTSAFGTFFIGNTESFPGEGSISGLSAYGAGGSLLGGATAPTTTTNNGSTFLGLATVDSVSGDLVPAISEIDVKAGSHGAGPEPDLDNFVFAGNPGVSPVPEGNVWALLAAAALAAVGLSRWRPAAPPKAARRSTMKTIIISMGRPLRCALCTALIVIAALWALPGSARAQLYASQGSVGGTVGEYDAVTGAAINASFITGLSFPNGLAVAGNTLFMTIYGYPGYGGPHGTGTLTGLVGEYDATTGAPINANLVTG
jgi:hypothetical protein